MKKWLLLSGIICCLLLKGNIFASESISESEPIQESVVESEFQIDESESVFLEGESQMDESETNALESEKSESDNTYVVGQDVLKIDDEHVYEGMNRTYEDGYEPIVENGKAKVILPLMIENGMDVKSVRVTPNLGMTQNSPFVFRNYQKTFELTSEPVDGTQEKKDIFLVEFEFDLSKERYNGIYAVTFQVDYVCQNMSMKQSFTSYISITDGKSTEQEPVVIVEEEPTSQPKVIIEKCLEMPDQIVAGDEFSFVAVLKNTNKLKYVQNMTVTVSCASDGVSLVADSNVFYYDYLGIEKTLKIPLTFKTNEKLNAGKYIVSLDISYDNPDAMSMMSSGKIEIDIDQKLDVELEVGQVPKQMNAGDSINVSLQAMNLGRGRIYNVRCSVDAPGLTANKSLFLGNMEGGSAASGEINLFAGMVNPDAEESAERYGQTAGVIELLYEDEDGVEYVITKDITMNIAPLQIDTSSHSTEIVEEEPDVRTQLIWGIVGVVGVIVLGTVIPLLLRKRANGKHK